MKGIDAAEASDENEELTVGLHGDFFLLVGSYHGNHERHLDGENEDEIRNEL